jgi:hypothetical protein
MINALERRERAAHRGDRDIALSLFVAKDHVCPCMTYFVLFLPTERGGQGDLPA